MPALIDDTSSEDLDVEETLHAETDDRNWELHNYASASRILQTLQNEMVHSGESSLLRSFCILFFILLSLFILK